MPALLNQTYLHDYRSVSFLLNPAKRVKSLEEVMEFINSRKLIAFWPLKNIAIPSLWVAAAGDRPVPDEHDDPGHVTWGWKDALLGQWRCFYARILCRRNFFISLDLLPYLYALSSNYGDIHQDHLILYEEGKLTYAARQIYDTILQNGPLDSIELKRITRMNGKSGDSEFTKAVDDLQLDFKLMPIGISTSGRWHYSFVYDIPARHFPNLQEKARDISEAEARDYILKIHMENVGATQKSQLIRLFKWNKLSIDRSLTRLINSGNLISEVQMETNTPPDWLAIPELVLQ